MVSTLDSRAVDFDEGKSQDISYVHLQSIKRPPVTNQTVTGSRLTGYIVNVMHSPVIERLMIRGSQVALKHANLRIHAIICYGNNDSSDRIALVCN